MSNKLSLLVNFIGVDKMSGAMRNIVGLGQRGSTSLRALNGEARKLQREMGSVQRELAKSSGNVTQLVNRERELETALAGVNRQLEKQKRSLAIAADRKAMIARGEELKGRGRDNVVGGLALSAPLILATKAAADFSSGMVDIQQKAELSDQAADGLASRIIVMAAAAKQLPENMRAGLDILLARGLKVDAATQVMGPAGRLATAFKVELPDAAGAAYASINNLKVAAGETARVFDVMAAAGNEGGFEVADMARNFPLLTAQMQALGDTGVPAVADLSAALQVAMNTAKDADQAANNIANLLGKINAPVTIGAFRKNFGVDLPAAMKKLTDEGKSSLEAIAMITTAATKGDNKKLGFAFEDTQARAGLLALIQGMEQYRSIRKSALNSGGTVDQAFGQRAARDATVNWRAFMGTASTLAITLGTTLLPVMTNVLSQMNTVVSAVSRWAQANPRLASGIIQTVAGLITLRVGLGAVQFAFGSLLGPLARVIAFFRTVDGISRFGTMMVGLRSTIAAAVPVAIRMFSALRIAVMFLARGVMQAGIMMMANPIVLLVMAIVAAIGLAAYLIYSNWGKIRTAFTTGVNWVKTTIAGLPAWLKNIGTMMMQGLLLAINPMALAEKLISVARNGITAFKSFLGIKSPSRVFMAMGGYVTEGLAQGIDRGGQAPVRAVGQMAARSAAAGAFALTPMRGKARGGQAGTGASAAPISIHIHGAVGQDVRELAREVRRELEHAQGIRTRRSYEDAA